MIGPVVLLVIALAGVGVSLAMPGFGDLLLLAGPCAVASSILLVRAWLRRPRKWILVDGSNVMHWKDGTPQIETLREVLRHLSALGFTPSIVFDANAGYKLQGKYKHHAAMSRLVGLPENRVMVVPKGTPADPFVLQAARDYGARVVSNDRFRDWVDDHPELRQPGHVIRGGYRGEKLWLEID